MPLNELVDYLVVHGKNHFTDPEAIAKEVQKAARASTVYPRPYKILLISTGYANTDK